MEQANYDLFTFYSKFAYIPGPIWRTSFFNLVQKKKQPSELYSGET